MYSYVHTFVETAAEAFELQGPVYEFGFCPDMPGQSGTRDCFPETGFIGCELGDAAAIDRLEDLARLPFPDEAARTVVCLHTLEHVFEPQRVVEEMMRILKPGGLLILCASVEPGEHEGLDNYWRPTPQAVQRLLAPMEASLGAWQGPERRPHTVYGIGGRGPVDGRFLRGANALVGQVPAEFAALAAEDGWLGRLRSWIVGPRQRHHRRDYHQVQFALHLPVADRFDPELLLGGPHKVATGTRLDLSQ